MTIIKEPLAVITADRERELEELSSVRLTQRSFRQAGRRDRAWIWQVESGMEEAFESLRSWLLSSVRDSEVQQANTDDEPP